MADAPQPKRPSRGFFWRQMRAGDPVGKPLAEWAYSTPRYPGGLVVSDLRRAAEGVQRETALIWFLANLEPFKLGPGPWFAFDVPGAGFGQGYWAPSPLVAGSVLREQFEGVLPDDLIQAIGAALGNDWMWIEPQASTQPVGGGASSKAQLQADLDGIESIIRSLVPEHGGIGHNAPDGEEPLTPAEHAAALNSISRIRAGLAAEPAKAADVKAGALGLAEIGQKLGRYCLTQADTFVTESNKAVAQKVPHLLGASILGWDRIEHLLAKIWEFLGHLPL